MDTRAPTLEDAHAAAGIAAEAGATKVLLFGSVARGEADEYSDIDLVAVFDDIDYSQRRDIARGLNEQIKAQVGVDNDVVVTDRPEWKARTQGEVPTCFEAGISVEAVPLVNDPPSRSVDWGKLMDLPVTRAAEAASRVKDVYNHLSDIQAGVDSPRSEERAEWEDNRNYSHYLLARDLRFQKICGAAHLTTEACLKLLLALYCVEPPKNIRSHSTFELTKMLRKCSPELADITERLRRKISHTEISFWQIASNYDYILGGRKFEATKERTAELIHLAERMTSHALAEYEEIASNQDRGYHFRAARDISTKLTQKVGVDGSGLDPEGFPGDNDPATVAASKVNQRRFSVLAAIRKVLARHKPAHYKTRAGLRRCGKPRADGKPCQRLLRHGSKCPYHPH